MHRLAQEGALLSPRPLFCTLAAGAVVVVDVVADVGQHVYVGEAHMTMGSIHASRGEERKNLSRCVSRCAISCRPGDFPVPAIDSGFGLRPPPPHRGPATPRAPKNRIPVFSIGGPRQRNEHPLVEKGTRAESSIVQFQIETLKRPCCVVQCYHAEAASKCRATHTAPCRTEFYGPPEDSPRPPPPAVRHDASAIMW